MKHDKPSDRERVEHVLKAIHLIETYSQGHTMPGFLSDQKTIDACLYQYTVIGEATACIDPHVLKKYNYPWHKVKSFRNFILHDYHAIEMRVIWDTTTEVLPGLKEIMQHILSGEF